MSAVLLKSCVDILLNFYCYSYTNICAQNAVLQIVAHNYMYSISVCLDTFDLSQTLVDGSLSHVSNSFLLNLCCV